MFYHDHTVRHHPPQRLRRRSRPYVLQDPVEQKLVSGGTIGSVKVAAGTIPADADPAGHPGQDFRAEATQLAARRPHLGHDRLGRRGQPLVPARLHAEPEPDRQPGRQRHGPLGLWPLVLAADGAGTRSGPSPTRWPVRPPSRAADQPGTPTPSIVPEAFMDTPARQRHGLPVPQRRPQGVSLPHPERQRRPHAEPAALLRQVQRPHVERQRHAQQRERRRSPHGRGGRRHRVRRRAGRPTAAPAACRPQGRGPEHGADRQRGRAAARSGRAQEHAGRL